MRKVALIAVVLFLISCYSIPQSTPQIEPHIERAQLMYAEVSACYSICQNENPEESDFAYLVMQSSIACVCKDGRAVQKQKPFIPHLPEKHKK